MISNTLDISIKKVENSRVKNVDFNKLHFGKIFSDHMFIADYKNGAWTDFRVEPYEKFEMSPSSAVIHYGQSIFEGMKAYKNEKGKILLFRPIDNFNRFNKSAVRMCMPTLPEELFMESLKELVLTDQQWIPDSPDGALYLRPFMFASDEFIGVRASDTYRFVIITSPVSAYYNEPLRVLVENNYTRAVEGGVGFVKAAGNYGRSLYPSKIAQEKGYHQLIWTDAVEHKYIEESGTMNVIFVIDDTLVTPPISNTILAGVTRDSVLTIAKDLGMKVDERRVHIDELIDAYGRGKLQGAFGTGTAATIAHIALIGYKGIDYVLPPVHDSSFSNQIKSELQKIRKGESKDHHNWIIQLN
jgi:branched-chain amino acid aminotransferase